MCLHCSGVLHKVRKFDKDGKDREVRGLRRCSSNVCSHASFMDRDYVGALDERYCNVVNGTAVSEWAFVD